MDRLETPLGTQARSGAPASSQAGYSIVEVLVAALLILGIAVGILPLFVQAIRSNLEGQDSTSVANHARTRAEALFQLPFADPLLEITAGSERLFEEVYSEDDGRWLDGTEDDHTGKTLTWTRTTRIRQYPAFDDADNDGIIETGELPDPLPAGTDPSLVHLKEIFVEVASTRAAGPLGAGKAIAVQVYKSE